MPAHMLPKPKPGSATAMRRARTRLAHAREQAAKGASKLRDGMASRYPGVPQDGSRLESNHCTHKGMGGDVNGRVSWQRSDYVTLTLRQHKRLHGGYLLIVPRSTVLGGDGPVDFYARTSLHQPLVYVGTTTPVLKQKRIQICVETEQ